MTVPRTISLSLVSHTNAGKTTLARTLLGQDVGEVRDAPHVTEFADRHVMLETAAGEALCLWDTPGFGDSLRLVRRLRQSERPLGWFMSQVWDRWRDRPFWATQQAMRNVRDEADVLLYLVNAAEEPAAAGYVQPEMELLAWVGKPVVVLLNQLGRPREPAAEEADVRGWREHLTNCRHVVAVLPLDAFARCWVQEIHLLRTIETALDGERRALMARLRAAWQARRLETFEAAMRTIAESLARTALATETVPPPTGLRERVRGVGARLGLASAEATPADVAQKALAQRLDGEVRANTQALVRLHGLEGPVESEILARVAASYDLRLRVDEGQAAVWGGVVTGALAGLKADLLSGGLTMGGGLLAGGLLGALGAAGLARAVNVVRGTERSWVAWNAAALDRMAEAALLRYLAVAHFGRGRGDWARAESPPHWQGVVEAALAPQHEALAALWEAARSGRADGAPDDLQRLALDLQPIVEQAGLTALGRLYPGSLEPESAARDAAAVPDRHVLPGSV
ncbi:MAG: GTPase domain-containing protein [Proteobacteria bacterium]|nr:GTPase domain-containing protein [Pseudomonadota bacterium]